MHNGVVQAVLLYGSEIWALVDAMMKFLEGLHNRITSRITGMAERGGDGEEWE